MHEDHPLFCWLLLVGADPDDGAPLCRAAQLAEPRFVQLLLEHGAQPNCHDATSPLQVTPLQVGGRARRWGGG
jgi:hypothetical protein